MVGGDVTDGVGAGGNVRIKSGAGRGYSSGAVVLETASAPAESTRATSSGALQLRTG